ncbi:hypothetical protein [Dactylosporangium darangshiense]|uniref:Uncharacterized protein n=1 Tax=Dactylosporangium darangshiense TaxID=579108 RepID=A0ABP8DMS5_9ACTN
MPNQPTREHEFAAGAMSIHSRTIVFDCIDETGPVAVGIVVDETALASDIARVIAGLALLAGDHAELAELHSAHPRTDSDHVAEPLPEHAPGTSAALVPLHRPSAVPFQLLQTPTERAADRLTPLLVPHRPRAIRYRAGSVAHHGGDYVAPGRRVVAGTWRYPSPELCEDDRRACGVWIGPPDQPCEQVLVCVSCGLDLT